MIVPDIASKVQKMRLQRYRKFPCRSNRASSLGHDCARALFYSRTAWRDASEPNSTLKLIFQEGDLHERQVLRDLDEAGFDVIEQQIALEWPEYQITGHVDAMVCTKVEAGAPAEAFPVDVKSMSGNIWGGIFKRGAACYSWEEVQEAFGAKSWLKKYAGQLVLYMLMKNVPVGCLLCKSKQTGEMAQVVIEIDYGLGEELLKRAEKVNDAVARKAPPDRIAWDEDVCGRCEHLGSCLPDRVGEPPIKFVEISEISELLWTRSLNEKSGKEYAKADKRIKEWAKVQDDPKIVVGDWLLQIRKGGGRTTTKITHIEQPS